MANTSGQKELNRNWPNEVGLTAETTKQEGQKPYLEPQELDLTEHWGSI